MKGVEGIGFGCIIFYAFHDCLPSHSWRRANRWSDWDHHIRFKFVFNWCSRHSEKEKEVWEWLVCPPANSFDHQHYHGHSFNRLSDFLLFSFLKKQNE